jgi:hypothetical protein
MRANEWEGIGKELKIKRKFYVSSRDVNIVCPRVKRLPLAKTIRTVIYANEWFAEVEEGTLEEDE